MADAAVTDLRLSTAIATLPGVDEKTARCLARLGAATVSDLLRHLPMRYEYEAAEDAVAALPIDGVGVARGEITATRWAPAFRGRAKGRFEATLTDGADELPMIWFNASYLRQKLHPGMIIRVQGKTKAYKGKAQMINPKWEALDDPDRTPKRGEKIRPIYPATQELSSQRIEKLIASILPDALVKLPDPLPTELMAHHNMPTLADAFRMVHQPTEELETTAARRRLAFNELLLLQLGVALKRHFNEHVLTASALRCTEAIDQHIRDRFPFDLTAAQSRVIREIADDLKKTHPMNRLLQGDVGSGKTVVALYAVLLAVANRKQAALMAPTELLAEQHLWSISQMLAGANVEIKLLTGTRSARSAPRQRTLKQIASGEIDVVIGTQALLTESVQFKDLAVVVIDEQHRFGVLQRALLRSRGGPISETGEGEAKQSVETAPHCLVMTATPIPRTLSLTIFGDLDVSTLDELPPGRSPVVTRMTSFQHADEVYDQLADRVAQGQQAYVVLPAIDDDNGAGDGDGNGLRNVREHVSMLRKRLKNHRVEAVHGRLKQPQREALMAQFRQGLIDVLVATTVIEVGVDVPNASVMIIEHAERFGLAQLHQLRGRVGRGAQGVEALCILVADPTTQDARRRLEAITATTDGFAIAEADLAIRGMGDFFGTRQSGAPPLRTAQIPDDLDLLRLAGRDAEQIVRNDPRLTHESNQLLRQVLLQQYGQTLGLIDVG